VAAQDVAPSLWISGVPGCGAVELFGDSAASSRHAGNGMGNGIGNDEGARLACTPIRPQHCHSPHKVAGSRKLSNPVTQAVSAPIQFSVFSISTMEEGSPPAIEYFKFGSLSSITLI